MLEKININEFMKPSTHETKECEIVLKLNEIIGVIWNLESKLNSMIFDPTPPCLDKSIDEAKNSVEKAIEDPFSRQRKWIGKLCKFWDGDDAKFYSIGILNSIKEDQHDPFDCLAGFDWTHCEPFFPDVSTIYTQGGNND